MELRAVSVDTETGGATRIGGVFAGRVPAPGSEALLAGVESAALDAAGFDGEPGKVITVAHDDGSPVVLAGLGDAVSFEDLRSISGWAIRAARGERAVSYLALVPVEQSGRAVVEGSVLGAYSFRGFKSGDQQPMVQTLDLAGVDQGQLDQALVPAAATNLARDWVNTPAGDLPPARFAELVEEAAAGSGLVVEVWDEERIADEKLGGILGVSSGSTRPPRVVILRHELDDAGVHLGLVGKGVTFDAGGLSIKPAKGMEGMKGDMAGAAAVAASVIAMARLSLPVGITAVIPMADNVIGGDALRPGDVLRPVAGPTIEVMNTDAEGRLILADGLGIVRRYEPDLIIDVATLTGSAHVALGDQIAGLFASSPSVARMTLDAAARAGEHLWELPLFRSYARGLESDVADIKNVTGARYGGAITAALFLERYAGDGPWAHIDMASTALTAEVAGEHVKGGTGYGVRTLVEIGRSGKLPEGAVDT